MNVVESLDSQSWEGMLEGRERWRVEIFDEMAEVMEDGVKGDFREEPTPTQGDEIAFGK
jgi:hypothetical protein